MVMRHAALAAFGCLIAYILVRTITSSISIYRFKRQHSCKPAARYPQLDPILGLDVYRRLKRNAKNRVGLEENVRGCLEEARTRTTTILGQSFITTCEPENIKAVLATNFKDFGIGARQHALGPLLGSGIFTTDDVQWEHSRVRDLPCVELDRTVSCVRNLGFHTTTD